MLPLASSSGPERMNCQMNKNGSNRPRRAPAKATLKYSRVPPDEGMADASSAQTMPSHTASAAPRIHPSMACGPPMEAIISGIVKNGPTPTMYDMFMDVACHKPKPRWDACCRESKAMFCVPRGHESQPQSHGRPWRRDRGSPLYLGRIRAKRQPQSVPRNNSVLAILHARASFGKRGAADWAGDSSRLENRKLHGLCVVCGLWSRNPRLHRSRAPQQTFAMRR